MKPCKYHPLSQASYHCQQCDTYYCDTCSDEAPQIINPKSARNCIRCEAPLEELDHKSDVEPFWRQLSSVYLYPLSLSGITVLSIVALIASVIPAVIVPAIISVIALISYGLICLNQTANGTMSPPGVGDLINIKVSALFKLVFLAFLTVIIIHLSEGIFGYDFAVLVIIFFTITLPATIITTVIDKKLFNAINPIILLRVVTATGISYFFLCLFSFIMISSIGIINQFLISDQPSFINYFATSFITAYYTIVIFHLMGYVVYQNHKQLGYSVKGKIKKTNIRAKNKRINDHIETLIKSGDYAKAQILSMSTINSETAVWEWERCFNLILITSEKRKLSSFVNSYLNKLSEHRQFSLMGECYLKAIKKEPSYQPESTKIILEVSHSLVEIGHYKQTILLLQEFKKVSEIPTQLRQAYTLLSKSFHNLNGYEKQATQYAMKAAKIKI